MHLSHTHTHTMYVCMYACMHIFLDQIKMGAACITHGRDEKFLHFGGKT
jgi:hypothetical protein